MSYLTWKGAYEGIRTIYVKIGVVVNWSKSHGYPKLRLGMDIVSIIIIIKRAEEVKRGEKQLRTRDMERRCG